MGKGKASGGTARGMMAQVQRLQEELARAQRELADEVVEVSAGGGAVRIRMSGTQECKAVLVTPALLQEGDVEMVQDLLTLAINQAIRESQMLAAHRLGPLTGALPGGMGPGG